MQVVEYYKLQNIFCFTLSLYVCTNNQKLNLEYFKNSFKLYKIKYKIQVHCGYATAFILAYPCFNYDFQQWALIITVFNC